MQTHVQGKTMQNLVKTSLHNSETVVTYAVVSEEKKQKEKKVTIEIRSDLWAQFNGFVESNGYIQKRAVAAAIELFQLSPAELRERLFAGEAGAVQEWFRAAKAGSLLVEMNAQMASNLEASRQQPTGARRKAAGGSSRSA